MALQSSSTSLRTKKSCFLFFSKKSGKRDLAQAMKELQEKQNIVQTLTIEKEELEKQLVDALRGRSLAEAKAADAEGVVGGDGPSTSMTTVGVVGGDGPSTSMTTVDVQIETVGLHQLEEFERLKEEAKANKDQMLQYKDIAQVKELALKRVESAHERYKIEAEKITKSHEAEVLSYRERISKLESDFSVKFKEAATVVAGKEEALSSALAELDILKAENSVKMSQIAGFEDQVSSLKAALEEEHQRWRDAQNNYGRQGVVGGDGPSTSMTTVASCDVGSSVARCQVVGCTADLTFEKDYCRKRKICDMHAKACAVSIQHRYCQKCNRFHLLSEFDGMKRSCRRALDMHNKRRRKS